MQGCTQDDVIALIYEAASGSASWAEALEAVRTALDCLVVQIVGVDLRRAQFLFSFESEGGLAEAALDYARSYHRIDPHAAYVAGGVSGQLISFSSVFDQDYVDNCPFYQDFLIPYGSRHMHGAKLHEVDGVAIMLGIHRGVGKQPIEGNDWIAAQRMCFHLTRAAKVLLATREIAASGVIAQCLLDRLRVPVYLIDANRRIVMRNRSSFSVAHTSGLLGMSPDGKLRCLHVETDQQISTALTNLDERHSSPTKLSCSRRTTLRIRRSGEASESTDSLVCFEVIRPADTMGIFGQQTLLMITQHPIVRNTRLDPFFLASAFELTPAEAHVASALAYGMSQKEIAESKGVSLHTVQAQQKSIHLKLGVRKNTELVALLHSVSFGPTSIWAG